MKTKKQAILNGIIALTALTLTPSCKKNDTGGKAEVHVKVSNNGGPIYNSTLYVKFDAHHEPSAPTSDYDLKLQGSSSDNHIHVEDLRPGEYYLYAVGINTSTGKTVKGGTAVEIKWKDRKKTIEADISAAE